MSQPAQRQPTRREVLRSSARYLALGGVTLMSAGLIAGRSGRWATDCDRRLSACRDCAVLNDCRLAPAVAAKKSKTT